MSYSDSSKKKKHPVLRWIILVFVVAILVRLDIVSFAVEWIEEQANSAQEGESIEVESIAEEIPEEDEAQEDSEQESSSFPNNEERTQWVEELGLTVMFDGTIFDSEWYVDEATDTGYTDLTEDTTEDESYRSYQLYGQGDGLSPYDGSSFSDEDSAMLDIVQEELWDELATEQGEAWLYVTAKIYDEEEVTVWNSEYTLSDEASSLLQSALSLFEDDGYDVGFVLLDLTTGEALSYRAGIEVYSASTIKAPYIFSLLEAGVEPTEDMYLAGNQSDNDAYLRVREENGDEIFAEWIEGTGIPQEQSESNYIMTTPLDLCRMFYKGTDLILGEEEYSDWARDTFTDSLNSAAALTIGETKDVYSKAGWISETDGYSVSSYTNAAIVDEENPYVVVMMSNSLGYVGLEYAQELMPVLDEIHSEMCGEEANFDPQRESLDNFESEYASDSDLDSGEGSISGPEGGFSDGSPDWPGNPENNSQNDGAETPEVETNEVPLEEAPQDGGEAGATEQDAPFEDTAPVSQNETAPPEDTGGAGENGIP